MIAKRFSPLAKEGNHLVLTEGAALCCGDDVRKFYRSATIDTATDDTLAVVNVTVNGEAAQTIAVDGAPIDWSDSANDGEVIAAIGKVVTDLEFEWMGGGISIERDGTEISILIKDSTLVFNWIGTTTDHENAFAESSVY